MAAVVSSTACAGGVEVALRLRPMLEIEHDQSCTVDVQP